VNKDKKPLSETHPELAKEAYGWDPKLESHGSTKKLSWKCNNGHVWVAEIRRRKKSSCPFCSRQKVLRGFNDLATTHPEIAEEANGWDPSNYLSGSDKIVEWKCKRNHKYLCAVKKRTGRGDNCPFCSNSKLLKGFNDLKTLFPEVAEEANGWDPSTVIGGSAKKRLWKCSMGHSYEAKISSRTFASQKKPKSSGCPYCANQKVLKGFNDLATTHPELAKEANGWDPSKLTAGSNLKKEWKCKKGHVWKVSSSQRTGSKSGCPYCANQKVLKGFNDLATTHPELAKEANGWDPSTVVYGTSNKKSWKGNCGHVWESAIGSRTTLSASCPYCSGNKVLKGFNDLATTNPHLANEADGWDPSTVSKGSKSKKLWKCINNHTWKATVSDRQKYGCPSCAKSGFDPNESGFLYFLIQSSWEIYQIGITNNPDKRLRQHQKNGFETIELRGPIDGHTAQELETALLRYLKSQNADLSPEHIAGKFDGYSESWTIDSYKVNNLKELIDKASEAGF